MKVTEITLSDEGLENNDWRERYTIKVNDKKMFQFSDGEPEDATLSRDFNDVYSIPNIIKMAWEAGKAGEELVFETVTED